jgi:hypothetical protein
MCERRTANILPVFMLASTLGLVTAACGGQEGIFTGGGVSAPSAAFTTTLVPSVIPLQPLPLPSCPLRAPFASQFSLVIAPGSADLFLHEIGFQFADRFGHGSFLFFSNSDLTTRFGSTLIVGGSNRVFPFQTRFGCGLSRAPESVAISLFLRDHRGGTHRRTLSARIG